MTTPTAIFGGLGFAEMLVIAFVAILVFGGRLPEVMRNLGRSYARFRQGLHEMSRPIREELSGISAPPSVAPPPAAPPFPATTPSVPYAAPGSPLPPAPPSSPRAAAPPSGPGSWDEPPPV